MSIGQRITRLEAVHQERLLRERAERVAAAYGLGVDEVQRDLAEIAERVQRWGIDEEIRYFAAEHDLSEADVREMFEEEQRKIEAEEAITIEG